jgi:hypothetical protein
MRSRRFATGMLAIVMGMGTPVFAGTAKKAAPSAESATLEWDVEVLADTQSNAKKIASLQRGNGVTAVGYASTGSNWVEITFRRSSRIVKGWVPRTALKPADADVFSWEPSPATKAAQLPKECGAESPIDLPCSSYAGTYRVTVRQPAPDGPSTCVVKESVTAAVTLTGARGYDGFGHATGLEALGNALGMKAKPDHRIGADVREGVCCVDLELSDQSGNSPTLVVNIARGASVLSAKAKDWTDAKDCLGTPEVEVTLVK